MKPTHPGRRPSQIAVALGAMLVTASCTGMSSNPSTTASLPSNLDNGVGQLLRYCDKFRSSGDLVTAAGLCERAHRLNPADPKPLMQLAEVLIEMGELQQAAAAYRTIIKTAPENTEARYALGKAYIALEQFDLALVELQAALRYKAGDPRIYNALGVANGLIGAHGSAQEVFQAGLKVAPKDVSLRTNFGLSLALSGRYEEGIAVLEGVTADSTANETSHQNLQLARGLANVAQAEQTLAAMEPPADPLDENAAPDGLLLTRRSDEYSRPGMASAVPTADSDAADDDSSAPMPNEPVMLTQGTPWIAAANQRAEGNAFADADAPGASAEVIDGPLGDDNAVIGPTPVAEPDSRQTSPVQTARAQTARAQTARAQTARVQTARAGSPELSDAGPPAALIGDYLSVDVAIDDLASEDRMPHPATTSDGAMPKPLKPQVAAIQPGTPVARAFGGKGVYAVQLASYHSESRALLGWEEIRAAAPDLLGDIEPVVRRAELGPDSGTFYRLRVGPGTKSDADRLCAALQSRGIDCLIIREHRDSAENGSTTRATGL